jgi:hypothetical protein
MTPTRTAPTCPACGGRLVRIVYGPGAGPADIGFREPDAPRYPYRCPRCREAFAADDVAGAEESGED